MKGNKIAIDRYLETGEVVDSLDLSVNYLVKSTREGGTVPLNIKNKLTWCSTADGTGDIYIENNTDTTLDLSNVSSPSAGYPYLISIDGQVYTTLTARGSSLKQLKTVSLANITSIPVYAFYGCTALVSITAPLVTTVDIYAFDSCAELTTVNMPSAYSILYNAFSGCTKLSLISLSTSRALNIGLSAFEECSSLRTFNFTRISSLGSDAFMYSGLVGDIDFSNSTKDFESRVFAYTGITSFKSAGSNFAGGVCLNCTSLKSVKIDRARTIASGAFKNCSSLKEIEVGTYRTTSVCTLYDSDVFDGCTSLAVIYVPDQQVNAYKAASNWSAYADKIKGISEKPAV